MYFIKYESPLIKNYRFAHCNTGITVNRILYNLKLIKTYRKLKEVIHELNEMCILIEVERDRFKGYK